MKAFVVLVVIAAVAAAVWFLFLSGGEFGVGDEHPLGSFEVIAAWCGDRDMPMEPVDEDQVRLFFGDAVADRPGITAVRFLGRAPKYPHFVMVVRDASGKVVACGGQGRSAMFDYSTTGTATVAFLAKYWVEVAGDRPEFRDEQYAPGAESVRWRCDWKKGLLAGTWIKDWGGGMRIAHQVVDKVVFVLQ
jgi:hypothetical protein